MPNWYVSRDGTGAVVGLFARPQPGVAAELLADTDPAIVTFLGATTTANLRAAAIALLTDPGPLGKGLRALLLLDMSENNLLRQRDVAQDAVVAAATSFADLKTRWAAMAVARPMPDRTPAQAKAAAVSKLTAGDAD